MHSEQASWGLKAAAWGGLVFLHFPILIIFLYAFNTESAGFSFPPKGLTLGWFSVALARADVLEAIMLSLKVASIATLIAMLLGTLAGGRDPAAATEVLREMLYDGGGSGDGLSVFATFLSTHNAQVALLAFALGAGALQVPHACQHAGDQHGNAAGEQFFHRGFHRPASRIQPKVKA